VRLYTRLLSKEGEDCRATVRCIDRGEEGGTDKERMANVKSDEIRDARCTCIRDMHMDDESNHATMYVWS